jgi:hypothetical protein
MAVSIPCRTRFVGRPDSASPNPEEHFRLEWCSFRAGDLIVVNDKLFAAVFLVRFIALTSSACSEGRVVLKLSGAHRVFQSVTMVSAS